MTTRIEDGLGLALVAGLLLGAAPVHAVSKARRKSGLPLTSIIAFGAGAASGYAMAKGTPLSYDGPLLVGTPLVMGVAATMGASMGGYESPGSAFPKAAGKAAFGEVLGYGAGYLAGWL